MTTKYGLIDLECNCSKGDDIPRNEMEIIEIGCVVVDSGGKVLDELDLFVKPVIHEKITDFCTELTGITQDTVDNGIRLVEALKEVYQFLDKHGVDTWLSWGYFDYNKVKQEVGSKQINLGKNSLLDMNHINLSYEYFTQQGLRRKVGVRKALRQKKMEFIGRPHSGIDDVRNIARLLPYVCL